MPSLFLVRHAIAEPRGDAWPDDAARPLTRKGQARMRDIAGRLLAIGESADAIFTSPLKRAAETAAILSEAWGVANVEVLDALAPGYAPSKVMAEVAASSSHARLALVGHEPDLGVLGAWLIGAHLPLPFKKGGVARIDVESWSRPRDSQLIWLATPRLLLGPE